MSTQPKTFLTAEEYLEIERKAGFKSEYYNGRMSAMPRENARHACIISNLIRAKDLSRSVPVTGIDCVLKPSEVYDKVDWAA